MIKIQDKCNIEGLFSVDFLSEVTENQTEATSLQDEAKPNF